MESVLNGEQRQSAVGPEVQAAPWWRRRLSSLLLLAALSWTAVVVAHGITKGEFCYINDEALHAVTGLFFADFLHDLPLTHPIEYTFRFEAQYPALGILRWPPVFHAVEGAMFLLLGRTVLTARLAILLFTLLGVSFWFKLVSELQDAWTAAVSAMVLVSLPSLLVLEKVVMLEIPGLALAIAASYYWIRYLAGGRTLHLGLAAALAAASVLTIYHTVYLPVFFLLALAAERQWKRLLEPRLYVAAALALLVVGPYSALAYRLHGRKLVWLAVSNPAPQSRGLNAWVYYLHRLPMQLGWPLLVLSLAGLVTSRWWAKKDCLRVMLAWIAACYLTMSRLGTKEPRYIIYWLPAFVFFAAAPLTAKLPGNWLRRLRLAAALGLLAFCFRPAWTFERPMVSGYEAAARRVIQQEHGGLVLYDGDLPGNFIFFMRSLDPARRFIILRKSLYEFDARTPFITTRAELQDFVVRYGIRCIVISENIEIRFDVQRYLRELVQSPEVRLVERFPVRGATQWYKLEGRETPPSDDLLFYERTVAGPRSAHSLTVQMPTLGREITIPLDETAPKK
jgi:hypothetical protein